MFSAPKVGREKGTRAGALTKTRDMNILEDSTAYLKVLEKIQDLSDPFFHAKTVNSGYF
jgi:hypothetical protein